MLYCSCLKLNSEFSTAWKYRFFFWFLWKASKLYLFHWATLKWGTLKRVWQSLGENKYLCYFFSLNISDHSKMWQSMMGKMHVAPIAGTWLMLTCHQTKRTILGFCCRDWNLGLNMPFMSRLLPSQWWKTIIFMEQKVKLYIFEPMLQVRCWALGWEVDNAAGMISALFCKFCCWYRNKIHVQMMCIVLAVSVTVKAALKFELKLCFFRYYFRRSYGSFLELEFQALFHCKDSFKYNFGLGVGCSWTLNCWHK